MGSPFDYNRGGYKDITPKKTPLDEVIYEMKQFAF
jgi:hypothetical protein